jgi:hypothetical protein
VSAGAGGFATTTFGLAAVTAGGLVFVARGAATGFLAAASGVTTLLTGLLFTGVVTIFFAEGGFAFGGDLATDFTGATGFFAAVFSALVVLAATALAFGCGLAATGGLAFLVLVAFNS